MTPVDVLVLSIVLLVLQGPSIFVISKRDAEIRRLNQALLRVEKPHAAREVSRVSEPQPEPEPPQRVLWR